MKILIIIFLSLAVFGSGIFFTWEMFEKPRRDLAAAKSAPPLPPPPDQTIPEFNRCVEVLEKGTPEEARVVFQDFLERYPESTKLEEAKDYLGELNSKLLLSPAPGPDKQVYLVRRGDVISRVAAKLKTTPELIMLVNGMDRDMLRIDQKLSAPVANFSLALYRRTGKVAVLNDGKFFKHYPSISFPGKAAEGAGKKGTPKPGKQTGKVTEKISWKDGLRINFTDKGYATADHWIMLSIPGHAIYSERPPQGDVKQQKPPGGGIGIAPLSMQELAAFVSRSTVVTLE